MATADLTNVQLNAAATATMTIPQPVKQTSPWTGVSVRFYRAAASAGALANKLVCEVYDSVSGIATTIATDDITVFPAAEIATAITVLKRAVVEARARAGAA